MPNSTIRDILLGVLLASLAAYGYGLALVLTSTVRANLILYPLFGLVMASWFVVPLGAIIGFMLPRVVKNLPSLRALLVGALFAMAIGLLGSFFFTVHAFSGHYSSFDEWWRVRGMASIRAAVELTLYSAPWTLFFAYRRSRRGLDNRVTN